MKQCEVLNMSKIMKPQKHLQSFLEQTVHLTKFLSGTNLITFIFFFHVFQGYFIFFVYV